MTRTGRETHAEIRTQAARDERDVVRSRTITWSDPARTRVQLHGLDGYERLVAIQRGDALPAPADAGCTTLELSTNFVRPITQTTGRVRAVGRVLHEGGRVATTEARVYDDAGTLYAHAKSTSLVQSGARR